MVNGPQKEGKASKNRLPNKIGRYRILGELGRGGMAYLYLGRAEGPGGFERLAAIKLIHDHFSNEKGFIDMFLDEARITSAIQHPNVVQVFDLVEHEDSCFLVMEFLRGQSLSRVIKRVRTSGRVLPVGFCLGVLARAAAGLHAAHESTGHDGKPLGIVHRYTPLF